MLPTKQPLKSRRAGLVSLCLGLILIAAAIGIYAYRQTIWDQIVIWQYQPSSQIASIAERSSMTDKAKRYFYASQPEFSSTDEFNSTCQRREASSAILGCYNSGRIYLYSVDNDQLDGINEVTAAHEMLHAAWQRLSESQKEHLSTLLETAYDQVKTPDLSERMSYYDRNEPSEHANELHSILGTEFADLGSELEEYYSQYFNDRTVLLTLYNNYQQVFDDIKDRSAALVTELEALVDEINSQTEQYNTEVLAISQDIAALNARASQIDRSDYQAVAVYNQDRELLILRIDSLEATRQQINQKTVTYNSKLTEYNDLAVMADELNKSIDSVLSPSPSL